MSPRLHSLCIVVALCAGSLLLPKASPQVFAAPQPRTARSHKAPRARRTNNAQRRRKRTRGARSRRSLRRTHWRSLVYRLRTPNPRYQRRVGQELRRRGEVRALPYLLGMLRKRKQANQRQGALRALAQLQLPWTLPVLLARRHDPVPAVRLVAWEALGDFCADRACRQLKPQGSKRSAQHHVVNLIRNHLAKANASTAKVLLRALSTIDDASALPHLQTLYKSKRLPGIGLWYSRTLAALGDPAKRQKWQALTTKRFSWAGRRWARWPGRWASQLLAKGLHSPKASRRQRAARWLLRSYHPLRAKALLDACQRKALSRHLCRRITHWSQRKQPSFPTTATPLYLVSPAQAKRDHAALSKQSPHFAVRLERISRRMLGTPYVLDPLGEGKRGRYDRDPIFTLKRADCVTFVEQVIAMTHVPSLPKAIQFAQRIRYHKGRIDYRYRRHLPIAQWIPAMIQMGIGRDITQQIGGDKTSVLHKTIDAKSYSTREGRKLQHRLGKKRIVMGHFKLHYLTHDVALTKLKQIPSGTVISSLRNHNPYSPGQVTHQGLLIRRKGILYMRHASSLWRSIVDVPLRTYLRILKNYPRPRIGIHLLQLQPKTQP